MAIAEWKECQLAGTLHFSGQLALLLAAQAADAGWDNLATVAQELAKAVDVFVVENQVDWRTWATAAIAIATFVFFTTF